MIPTRLLRALPFLGLLLAAIAIAVPAAGQTGFQCNGQPCEQNPPTVTIAPSAGAFDSTSVTFPVTITIDWCDDNALSASSREVWLNGQRVDSLFTYVTLSMNGSCRSRAQSVGTVALQDGTNTLQGRILDTAMKEGTRTVLLTYTRLSTPADTLPMPATYTMDLAATGDPNVRVGVGKKGAAVFTLHNTGNRAGTFILTPSCSGAALSCEATPQSVTVPRGGATSVAVQFTASGTVNQTGTVTLTATWQGQSGVQDAASQPVQTGALPSEGLANDVSTSAARSRSLCLMLPAGLDGGFECGDLRLAHPLPPTRTLNQSFAPTLLYLSAHAAPRAQAGASVTLPAGKTGQTVTATLTRGGTTETRNFSPWTAGQGRRVTVDFDASALATSAYAIELGVSATFTDASTQTLYPTTAGVLPVVNRSASPFGRGWWLAGVETLVTLADSTRFWVGGDGSTNRYHPVAGQTNVFAAEALGAPDTLVLNRGADSAYYERRVPGGGKVYFNAAGRQVRTVDALGRTTRFTWSSDNVRLLSVELPRPSGAPTAQQYTFEYNGAGGVLSRVVAPGNRIVDVYSTSGRIDSIAGPDASRVRFVHDASGRITDRYDRRGVRTSWAYGHGGKLANSVVHMETSAENIISYYVAQEGRGIAAPDSVEWQFTVYNGPRPVQDYFYSRVNRLGAPIWTQDALVRITRLYREDPRFPALVTRVQHPNLREVTSTYDDGGRTTSTTDWGWVRGGRAATTLYEWDRTWNAVTRVTSPTGETRTTAYESTTGRRLWEQVGADTLRRVRYQYHPLNDATAPGMLERIVTPDGEEHLAYDGRGNVAGMRTVEGFWTSMVNDSLGRPVQVWTPVDSATSLSRAATEANGALRQVWYDAMGRDTLEMSRGPKRTYSLTVLPGAPADSTALEELWVRKRYDAGGLLLSVDRWTVPDANDVDTIRTEWRHDRARRTTREWVFRPLQADSTVTVYDHAGNVVQSTNRLGETITMEYDLLNRLQRRITPAVTRGGFSWTAGDTTWAFPYFVDDGTGALETKNPGTTALVIPADTATFTYHITGGIETANNRDARVRREYYDNGLLKAETQRIRTYVGTDTTSHVYRLEYDYDRSGRRTMLRHPRNLLPASQARDSVLYGYRAGTGELASITGLGNESYAWSYDPVGRLQSFTRNQVTESFQYDAFGRQARRVENSSEAGILFDDRFRYDARGKMVGVTTLEDQVQNAYTGLGTLHRTLRREVDQNGTADNEIYGNDALGNLVRSTQQTGGKGDLAYTSPPEEHRYTYERYSGRMLRKQLWFGGVVNAADTMIYDAAGNRRTFIAIRPGTDIYDDPVNPTFLERTESFYDAAGRLRVQDRRTCLFWNQTCDAVRTPLPGDRSAFEEYRYDALGRRVLVRSRQEFRCPARCQSAVRRTVWDGDHVLWEISAPGWTGAGATSMERDTGFAVPVASSNFRVLSDLADTVDYTALDSIPQADIPTRAYFYGRVHYVHGPGIDAPLSLTRYELSDSLRAPITIYPHADWRGTYALGTFGSGDGYPAGRTTPPCRTIVRNTNFQEVVAEPNLSQEPKPIGPRNTPWQHCVEIIWPGPHEYVTRAQKGRPTLLGPPMWMGGQIDGMRDVSGMMYRRNRYYDPTTGQFTQIDPIGIAGGLNVYGYADGDPVSYHDPFGLCVPKTDEKGNRVKTECERFAEFADRMADRASDDDHFVRILGEYVSGFPGGEATLDPGPSHIPFGSSGFRPEFDDGDDHAPRHFTANLVVAYQLGTTAREGRDISRSAAILRELVCNRGCSIPDIRLGRRGAELGYLLRTGRVKRTDVGNWIRENL